MIDGYEWIGVLGIALEIAGFVLMLFSTRKLILKSALENAPAAFDSDEYVDPKTGKPPKYTQSAPNPLIFKPGIFLVMFGLFLQILQLLID